MCMPLAFSIGERILGRPERTVGEGVIVELELAETGESQPLIGGRGRLLANHLVVETTKGKTYIPNEQIRRIVVDESK